MSLLEIKSLIVDVPDFPKPGIVFKDITPVLANPAAFAAVIEQLAEHGAAFSCDGVLAIESRGFIFGAPLAQRLGLPLQLVRKRGKLPRAAVSVRYELEYGFDHLEMHADAIAQGRPLRDRRRRDRDRRHRGGRRRSSRSRERPSRRACS